MTLDACKNEIVIQFAGGIAEQVFGIDKAWMMRHDDKKHEKNIDWQVLSKNNNICKGLANLFLRPSASSDMISAHTMAAYIVEWQSCKKDSPNFQDQICKILEECYQKALTLVQSQKSQIEKIANMLIDKNIMSGSELYAALHIQCPLYEFEIINH
jgi:hypothetical protein